MFDNVTVQGIVLDTSLVKEYDKRIVLLTVELGRITVFANGARRKNSPFTAVCQKFVMGEFVLRPGSQNTYSLVSSSISNNFMDLSRDLEKLAYASYACELVGYFTQEGVKATDELNLLYVTFKAIINEKPSLTMIKSVLECKLMHIEGILSIEALRDTYKPNKISEETEYIVNYILSRKISELYSFDVSEKIVEELEKIVSKYLKKECDRHFKSLDILKPLL